MTSRTVAAINTLVQAELAGRLPEWVEVRWFEGLEDMAACVDGAEIGWLDTFQPSRPAEVAARREAIARGSRLRWLNTAAAGVETYPMAELRERGIRLTSGAGLNAITIAEYAVMGMLTMAKGYREVVRAQDRHEWLAQVPGKRELFGDKALILGAGGIGGRIGDLLRPFGVDVSLMRRTPGPGLLGPDDWRGRLGEFDWVIVTVASTPQSRHMVGAAEFAAMKPGAIVMNFSRGFVIDTEAMLAALRSGRVGGAFLDVTDPEPLPPDHSLWSMENVHVTMHLSGRSQDTLVRRAAERFLGNLDRFARGEPLLHQVDTGSGA